MFTLYAVPFTCSLAIHATLAFQEREFEVRWVHRGPNRQISDADFMDVNPKRKVPVLVSPDGERLTEMVGIAHYLDERAGYSSVQRRRHLEWLGFLSSELHQQVIAPLFDADAPVEHRLDAVGRLLPTVLGPLDDVLSGQPWLTQAGGPRPADMYLLWGLMLLRHHDQTLLTPALAAFLKRGLSLPTVARTLGVERSVLGERSA